MSELNPFDEDHDDDEAAPEPFPTLTSSGALVSAAADPRETLARILESFATAFGTDAGETMDRVLTHLALLLTQYTHRVFPLRLTITGPTGAGKTRLLHVIANVLRIPSAIIPVVDIAETTWRGAQIGEACRLLHPHLFTNDGVSRRIGVPTQTVALPAVLLLDEIDKLALVATRDDSRFESAAMASRIGRQQTLLPVLDPLSTLLIQSDDAYVPFRWTLQNAVVICAGAFMQLPQHRTLTSADLCGIGLLPELVDRMGPVLTLPSASAATRVAIANGAVREVDDFADSLGVRITGIAEFAATLEAPGVSADYIGVRGLMDHVRMRMLAALAVALAERRSEIDVRDLPADA